jgi:hypothetical protein
MSAAADVTQEAENIKPLNLLKEHGTGGQKTKNCFSLVNLS